MKKISFYGEYDKLEDGKRLLYDRAVMVNFVIAWHKILGLEIPWENIRIRKKNMS